MLRVMIQRGAEMLREDTGAPGSTKIKEAEPGQQRIVAVVA
jgi:flagellar motor switch protein FliG